MPTKKLQDRIKGHWLAEVMEAESRLNDSCVLRDSALILQKKGQLPVEMRESLIAFTMDKCLSIHVNYLSEDLANHPVFNRLKETLIYSKTQLLPPDKSRPPERCRDEKSNKSAPP
ncbi:hypothetical protein [Pseudomonas cannabina]|uniref:hypothetical protein n=1 Tax=Pseudomonas cannabina TaxID=86840 RepID=UPI0006D63456|nr:hypothetical protein [Pseudomonas cannabina]